MKYKLTRLAKQIADKVLHAIASVAKQCDFKIVSSLAYLSKTSVFQWSLKVLEARYFYLSFCITCFVVAFISGLLLTQSGSGISPDSTGYIRVGENLYHGKGFTFVTGVPFTYQPPFYPLSITSFMYLGIDSVQAARLIPILCFALLMFPIFSLAKRMNGVFTAYSACLIFLAFTPFLFITSYAWTEMIYILFSTLAILFLVKFQQSSKAAYGMLSLAGVFVAFALLTRYIGITLLVVGLIAIVLKNRSLSRRLAYQTILFSGLSIIPIIPWIYRNIILTSSLTGMDRKTSTIGFLANTIDTVETIIDDFSSWAHFNQQATCHINLANPTIIIVISLILFIFFTVSKKYFKDNYLVILYPLVYLITLIIMRSTWNFNQIGTRLVSPAYPFLILALITFTSHGYKIMKNNKLKYRILIVFIALYALFLGFQSLNSLDFYQYAKNGQGYTRPYWRNIQIIDWASDNVPDEVPLYSDHYDVLEYRLKRLTYSLPRSENARSINNFIGNLENQGNAYIICFKDDWHRSHYLFNYEITEINQESDLFMEVIDFPEATVWKVNF